MSFDKDETSVQDAQPVELYLFTYDGVNYTYTSYQRNKEAYIDGTFYTFNAEYIKRSDELRLGSSDSNFETCTITVPRTNNVALLYQGAPPEVGSVRVQVYRVHGTENSDYIKIIDGTVSQANFSGSEADLIISVEGVLSREIPRGKLSYYCQNCLYDNKCKVIKDAYALKCYVDIDMTYTHIMSTNLNERPSGYFTDGFIKMGNAYRAIKLHSNNSIWLKYPISLADKQGEFIAYPGCDRMFKTCATKFNNTDNFSGIPYIEPYNAFTHPVGGGAYWVDGNIVYRDTHGKIYTMGL